MEERRKDARREPVIVDLEALVPEEDRKGHGLRVAVCVAVAILLP